MRFAFGHHMRCNGGIFDVVGSGRSCWQMPRSISSQSGSGSCANSDPPTCEICVGQGIALARLTFTAVAAA